MSLFDILVQSEASRVFILGVAKNAGKTFTLNALIRKCETVHERLGLTSTGRDGEPLDLVTGKSKPRVFCPKGTIVSSAAMAIEASSALLKDLEPTGIETALGEVLIGEVEKVGNAELAGPLFAGDLEAVLERMEERGAERVFVDGSLDRKAAGRIVNDVVLSVGAVIGRSMDEVCEKALSYVEQITLPKLPDWIDGSIGALFEGKCGALIQADGSLFILPFSTLMGRGLELQRLTREHNAWGVFVSGALGDELFSSLLDLDPVPRLVVRNASSLFVQQKDWRRYLSRGGVCYAAQPLRLLAVTVNPFSPEGWEFPAQEFLEIMKETLEPLPVFNPAFMS